MSDDLQNEINRFGIESSPAFVPQPKGRGMAKHAIRTPKDQLLWKQDFATVKVVKQALADFATEYSATWIRQRHGYKAADQIGAEQKGLAPEAAKEIIAVS